MSSAAGDTVKSLLQWGAAQVALTTEHGQLDAQVLLAHSIGQSRTWLFAHQSDTVSPAERSRFIALVEQRVSGMPVAYLIGECEFWSLTLKVTGDVLTPRADTETLVDAALGFLKDYPDTSVLDAGTGSGAIAVALAVTRPDITITATDLSPQALAVAKLNIEQHACQNISVIQSHWFQQLSGKRYRLIVSNPPYIAKGDPHLTGDGVRHEPDLALTSGTDGLTDIRHIIVEGKAHLLHQGALYLEHGYDQADTVARLFKDAGYQQVQHFHDLSGIARVTGGVSVD